MLVCSLSLAEDSAIEEITVLGRQQFLETEFTARRTGSNVDAAKLISQVPGGSAVNNGPLTGQIQYRGMFGPRINVRVDGMLIHGGGPNWMAPPLHHIPAGLMEKLVIEQGIASIATGGGIGGAATAYWKRPSYSNGNSWVFSGDTEASISSVDSGNSISAVLGVSTNDQRLYLVGSQDKGEDHDTPEGSVNATQYNREAYGIGYGLRVGNHEFDVDFRRLKTDNTGTPSLPMDIDWFHTDLWNASYHTELNGIDLELRVYGSGIDHGMTNYTLRTAPDFSSLPLPPFLDDDRRMVEADSDEIGYSLSIGFAVRGGDLIAGLEGKTAEHHATVSDPDFAPFFVNNFNGSEVDSLALFGQWSSLINHRWYVETGARLERVATDTGTVDAFPARLVDTNPGMWPMGTPPRAVWMLRETFNEADLSHSDKNLDWVVKVRYQVTPDLIAEFGVAQKSRSPLYQERFLWIPLEVNAGLGDGNNYVGTPGLDPEVSRQVELGLDWNYGDGYLTPRIYYRRVDDFIQGVPATNMAAIAVSANANGDPTPLTFVNTDSEFWGADVVFGIRLGDNWRIDGMASLVNGEREDISDSLYRISPASLRVGVLYEGNGFSARFEQIFMAAQNDVSKSNTLDPLNGNNSFERTDGYLLTNIFLDWRISDNLTIVAGVENLLDEDYVDHLTGFNRVMGSSVPIGSRLFGPGRNVFGRLQYLW
ncbi:MAG: ligand-gated channel [Acidiferrobacteraceae bacterium]|jgi:iron complex outermembrane receptor protein|nr:ligand-gated channel [Acidiferrobacteraceae bacterium]|tara:strand:+ start:1732 stop:3852 length:2121 start_codon:yes stop_codon:yes gene_type:complete